MFCPQTILINKKHLYINFFTTNDYNYREHIPKLYWLNPFRYEVIIFKLKLNEDHKNYLPAANFGYRVKAWLKALIAKGE